MRYQPQGRVRLAPQWAGRVKFISTSAGIIVIGTNPAHTKVATKTGVAVQTIAGQYLAHFPDALPADVDISRASVSVLAHVRDASDGGFNRTVIAFAANTSGAGILKSASGASRFFFDVAGSTASFVTYPLDKTRPRLHTISATGLASPKVASYVGDVQITGSSTVQVSNGISIGCHGATTQNVQSISEFYFVIGCYPALSREEHNSIDCNPWQLFAAPEEEYEGAAAPGAYTLSASPEAFTLSGGAAAITVSRKLAASPGAFAITGAASALSASRRLTAATGTLTLSGANASLAASRRLLAAAGSLSLTGSNAALIVARRLAASVGAFALVGSDAQLVYSPVVVGAVMVAQTGAFSLTGGAAILRITRRMQTEAASFAMTGSAVLLRCDRRMSATSGALVLTGGDAILRATRRMTAEGGNFTLTGSDAALRHSGQIEYARAPAGSGFTPQRNEYQARPTQVGVTRPAQVGGSRPAAIQSNNR